MILCANGKTEVVPSSYAYATDILRFIQHAWPEMAGAAERTLGNAIEARDGEAMQWMARELALSYRAHAKGWI